MGGNKRRLDICVCTKKLRDDLISEEHMTNPLFIKQLDIGARVVPFCT